MKRPGMRNNGEPEEVGEKTDPPVRTVLLVDDDDASRITTKWFLGSFGFVVESSGSAEEALSLFDPKIHDLVLTDNSMLGMSGAEMAHIIKLRSPSTPVLMCSGRPPEDRACLDFVMPKPIHLLTLKEAVDRIMAGLPPREPSANRAKLIDLLRWPNAARRDVNVSWKPFVPAAAVTLKT